MSRVKVISVLLAAVMCVSLLITPANALADEAEQSEVNTSESETQNDTDSAQSGRFTVVKNKKVRTLTGMCGEKTVWLLDDAGLMTISGVGDMYDWETGDVVPWKNNKDSIFAVVVSSGVTSIGDRAFDGCNNLKTLNVADTVIKIGNYAFSGCTNLNSAILDEDLYKNSTGLFNDCPGVDVSFIPGFPIIVNSGTSDMNKAIAGKTVTLTADIPAEGKVFDKWIVNRGEVVITGVDERTATFVMPSTSVEITASYKDSEPQNNTMTARGKRAKLNYRKLRKKAQKLSRTKVMTVRNAKGRVRYKLLSVRKSKYKKYFKVNSRSGTVTVNKKIRKGTYTVKCRVSASGNKDYKGISKTVSFKVKIK